MFKLSLAKIFIPVFLLFFISGSAAAQTLNIGGLDVSIGSSGGGDHVTIVGNISDTAVTNTLNNVKSFLANQQISSDLTDLITKEEVLDPIQWAMSKQFQQQLTGDVLKWLGGQLEGQNGEIPFIQNYVDHYRDISINIGGSFVFNGELTGLCSEEEDFLVTEEVYRYLEKSQHYNGALFSCPDDSLDDSVGTLERMARRIYSCNTPICAQYAAKKELALRQLQAVEIDQFITDQSNGLSAQKVCDTTTDSSGNTRSRCDIVSPLSLASDVLSFNLVELPGLQLLNMDEFNESVSNLMANLTNQALTSVTGALGLTGNPTYSNNVFGSDGTLSYVDALIQDKVSDYQSIDSSPIDDSLEAELVFNQIQSDILSEIDRVDTQNEANKTEYPGCYDLELTSDLIEARASASADLDISDTTVAVLTDLKTEYDNATDSSTRVSLLSLYQKYNIQGLFHTALDNQDIVISYVDATFAEMIDLFEYDMSVEVEKCD